MFSSQRTELFLALTAIFDVFVLHPRRQSQAVLLAEFILALDGHLQFQCQLPNGFILLLEFRLQFTVPTNHFSLVRIIFLQRRARLEISCVQKRESTCLMRFNSCTSN